MTLYDSSLLIDYLDGRDAAVEYVADHAGERAVAPPLVRYECYQGEVYRDGPADFDALEGALEWLTGVHSTPAHARAAAELQATLQTAGEPLAARDAFIAGAAISLGERLAVSDSDFDVTGVREHLALDVV